MACFIRPIQPSGVVFSAERLPRTLRMRALQVRPDAKLRRAIEDCLATGDVIDLRRGESFADADGQVHDSAFLRRHRSRPSCRPIRCRAAQACFRLFCRAGNGRDRSFIGSEGTLGVIVEAEVRLLPKPEGLLSGVVFFDDEEDLLGFVREARERSLANRRQKPDRQAEGKSVAISMPARSNISTLSRSAFCARNTRPFPTQAVGAIFFEQETTSATEDST